MWTRAYLKQKAKKDFKRIYWKSVIVGLIIVAVTGGISSINFNFSQNNQNQLIDQIFQSNFSISIFVNAIGISLIITLLIQVFVKNPIYVGCCSFFKKNALEEYVGFEEIISAFKTNYTNIALAMFMKDISIFLWSLLFVIPGIIKSYQYAFVQFILAENPNMEYKEAMKLSKQLTDGHKIDMFVLDLSFLGWNILAGLTLGILGIFYVIPYVNQTQAQLYLQCKENYEHYQTHEHTEYIF